MTTERRYTDRHHPAQQPLHPTRAPMPTHPRDASAEKSRKGHGGHWLMMILCCIPMLLVVGLFVATGAVGSGSFFLVGICMAMMTLMMVTMPGGHRH